MAQFVARGHGGGACYATYATSFPRLAGTTPVVYRFSYVSARERRPLNRTFPDKDVRLG